MRQKEYVRNIGRAFVTSDERYQPTNSSSLTLTQDKYKQNHV